MVINSGSNGKFLSRLDLELGRDGIADWSYRLLPVLASQLPANPAMAALITELRAPHLAALTQVVGQNESLLYRRGNFNGTFDDLICQALMTRMDAQIAFSPGFRWGTTLLPGQEITMEAIYNQTAITYPQVYRRTLTGEQIKTIMEEVADNLFNVDPYRQQGGDMVRVGGLRCRINPEAAIGQRIQALTTNDGHLLEPNKYYPVTGWAAMEEVDGPPVWEVLKEYVKDRKVIHIEPSQAIHVAT